ncbi:hypothetical protein WA577_006392 [Blastocystis sp. JDR]
MDNLLNSKKAQAQQTLRKLIFEDDEDPFQSDVKPIKPLLQSRAVPALQDGMEGNKSFEDGVKRNEVVHLVSKTGDVEINLTKGNDSAVKVDGVNHRRALEEVMDGKKKKEPKKEFWQLNTPEMTEEVKRELEIITMRDYLDTKSFFKGNRIKKTLPKEFEFGVVVNGNFDGKKNRLTRREKKASFADALADDKAFKDREKATPQAQA